MQNHISQYFAVVKVKAGSKQCNTFRGELLCCSIVLRRSQPRNVLQHMTGLSEPSFDVERTVVALNFPSNQLEKTN
jgi:hypothetical protein